MPKKKLRNPFKKSKKKAKSAKSGNPSLGTENSTQQVTQQDAKQPTFLDLALHELNSSDALKPSEQESRALNARLEGGSSDRLEDQSYFGLAERAGKGNALVRDANRRAMRTRDARRRGEDGLTIQDVEDQWERHDRIKDTVDSLQAERDVQRQNFLGRHTEQENTGLTSLGILGSGQMGAVHKVKVDDQSDEEFDSVFKGEGALPELGVKLGLDTGHGMNASREVASSRMDDLLGSNVITKTRFAEMDGERGSLMDLAHGESTLSMESADHLSDEEYRKASSLGIGYTTGGGENAKRELMTANDLDYSDPVLQQKLIELQIQDALSGQYDRHAENYHVQRDENGKVTGVTGFDNDASFGRGATSWKDVEEMEDWHGNKQFDSVSGLPPLVDEDQAARIDALDPVEVYQMVSKILPKEEAEAAVLRVHEMKDHIEELRIRGCVVKEWNEETFARLMAGDTRGSYVARDASYLEGLKAKEAEFQEWKEEQDAVRDQVDQLQNPHEDVNEEGGKKKKKKKGIRNPFKRKKKKK